ncbi:sugar ABC transporter permease [Saccharopolyspora erythraea]|uniref:carbohydrate ABC transporter permease n=1 Tax=Saccharopolyspora erythraea TaxID=1836 RepID=UPI001BADDBA2|nr:sugar ABC transporter permease [Saccharopolyspora erythraea]QUH01154.1 sugar ABC transporter permease [Saccharopolyspora erythraea]
MAPPGRSPFGRRLRVLAFMAPWIVGFTAFFAYPLLATGYFSFTSYDLLGEPAWVGLRNYAYLFAGDPVVRIAAANTVWLVVVLTVLRVVFALGVASVIARLRRGVGLVRTLCYLPALAPPVAATLAFVFLFNPGTGPVNGFLRVLGVDGPLWFNDPAWAKPALTLLTLWGCGELMIILLAALLDVPAELHEAAALDGAGAWRRFRHITIPSIAPVLLFGVVNSVIFSLQYFTQAVVAGAVASGQAEVVGSSKVLGFPDNSTLTFPAWLYQQGFHYYNMGYASAMAVLLFAFSLGFTIWLIRRMRIGVEEAA